MGNELWDLVGIGQTDPEGLVGIEAGVERASGAGWRGSDPGGLAGTEKLVGVVVDKPAWMWNGGCQWVIHNLGNQYEKVVKHPAEEEQLRLMCDRRCEVNRCIVWKERWRRLRRWACRAAAAAGVYCEPGGEVERKVWNVL